MLKNGVLKHFDQPIRLKSGLSSHTYINWREASNQVHLIDELSDLVIAGIQKNYPDCDCIYGVPEGGSKLALISQFKWVKSFKKECAASPSLAMGRAKPKLHGDPNDKYFIGKPSGKVVVLEDVVTTGQSLFNCLDHLKDQSINVLGVLVLTDRDLSNNVKKKIESSQILYRALTHISNLEGYLTKK